MLLENKTVLIMGIRNKWSIAWGAAMSAYENGAKVIFTHHPSEKEGKIFELIEEIPGIQIEKEKDYESPDSIIGLSALCLRL